MSYKCLLDVHLPGNVRVQVYVYDDLTAAARTRLSQHVLLLPVIDEDTDENAQMLTGMDRRLGPRWFDTGEGVWQHEETGRVVEGDDLGPFIPSNDPGEAA